MGEVIKGLKSKLLKLDKEKQYARQSSSSSSLMMFEEQQTSRINYANRFRQLSSKVRKESILSIAKLIEEKRYPIARNGLNYYVKYLELQMFEFSIEELFYLQNIFQKKIEYSIIKEFNSEASNCSPKKQLKHKSGTKEKETAEKFNQMKLDDSEDAESTNNKVKSTEYLEGSLFMGYNFRENDLNEMSEKQNIDVVYQKKIEAKDDNNAKLGENKVKNPLSLLKSKNDNKISTKLIRNKINFLNLETLSKLDQKSKLLKYFELDNTLYQHQKVKIHDLKDNLDKKIRMDDLKEDNIKLIFANINKGNSGKVTSLTSSQFEKRLEIFEKTVLNFLLEEEAIINKSDFLTKIGQISTLLKKNDDSSRVDKYYIPIDIHNDNDDYGVESKEGQGNQIPANEYIYDTDSSDEESSEDFPVNLISKNIENDNQFLYENNLLLKVSFFFDSILIIFRKEAKF